MTTYRTLIESLVVAGLLVVGHIGGAFGQQLYVNPPVVIEQPRRHYYQPPVVYCDRECEWRRHHYWRHEHEREYYDHRRDWR